MDEAPLKREPVAAHLGEVRMVMGGVTLVASPAVRGEAQTIPREKNPDRKVLWEARTPGGLFQVVIMRTGEAYLASYSGPRSHYLRLTPREVGGLVGALWKVLGLVNTPEEYIDIDTTTGLRITHLADLLALLGAAFRIDPALGRKVMEAAFRAYVSDICSSLRASPEGGGTTRGEVRLITE